MAPINTPMFASQAPIVQCISLLLLLHLDRVPSSQPFVAPHHSMTPPLPSCTSHLHLNLHLDVQCIILEEAALRVDGVSKGQELREAPV
jgi:hypothetical protein